MDKLEQIKWTNILLIFLLIGGLIWVVTEFRHIDKEGTTCAQSPFEYGELKAKEKGMTCTHTCYYDMFQKDNFYYNNSMI